MKEYDIKKIENELKIILPQEYKNIFSSYPFSDKMKYSVVSKSILDDVDEVIEINMTIRKSGFQNHNWPNQFFIFGYCDDNNFYFINLNDSNFRIYYAQDDKKFTPKNITRLLKDDNFEGFIQSQELIQKILNRRLKKHDK